MWSRCVCWAAPRPADMPRETMFNNMAVIARFVGNQIVNAFLEPMINTFDQIFVLHALTLYMPSAKRKA